MPAPPSTKQSLGILCATGLDAPTLAQEDPRWQRLQMTAGQGVDLRDRFRGALIGGAIGDAMGQANEGVSAGEARVRKIRVYQRWTGWAGGPRGTITDETQQKNSSAVR